MATTAVELKAEEVNTELATEKKKGPSGNGRRKILKGSTWAQVWMLLWKNFSLKKRRPLSTICELALPLIIVLLLSWLRTLDNLTPKTYDIGRISEKL